MSKRIHNPTATIVKRAQSRFIQIDEQCIEHMSLLTMAVYQQLRLLTDFTKDSDEVEITVKSLAHSSKISLRQAYKSLNELEYEHFVIQRLNYHHIRFGKVNSYNVARDYNFFQSVQISSHTAPHAVPVQKPSYGAHHAPETAHHAPETAQNDIPNNRSLSEVSHKKQYTGLVKPTVKTPVTVFCDTPSVKNHIELVIHNRQNQEPLEDEIIDQGAFYAYETNPDKSFDSVNKKINIFLKKVREGQWLIPQGWRGITSQSIRQKEEDDYVEKQEQYKKDGEAFRNIARAVLSPVGEKSLSDILKKLKTGS